MKTEIDPGELIVFYDRYGGDYDLRTGNEFRAFVMDFLCDNGENCCKENRRFRLKDIMFNTRANVEWIRKELRDRCTKTGAASVGTYYTLAQCSAKEEDFRYGWMNLESSYIYEVADDGIRFWRIHFPEPILIP